MLCNNLYVLMNINMVLTSFHFFQSLQFRSRIAWFRIAWFRIAWFKIALVQDCLVQDCLVQVQMLVTIDRIKKKSV